MVNNSISTSETEIYDALEGRNRKDYLHFTRALIETGVAISLYKTNDYNDYLTTIESTEHFDNYLELCRKYLEIMKLKN